MIAVVDEGLLSLTNFSTPDPTTALFPKQALGVSSYETVGWSIPTPAGAPAAGGGAMEEQQRAKVVDPVAEWSGIVAVPTNGTLTVPINIPQYSGQVRVMVVSSSPTRYASRDANVLVRDPLTLQATLPLHGQKETKFRSLCSSPTSPEASKKVTLSLSAKRGGAAADSAAQNHSLPR